LYAFTQWRNPVGASKIISNIFCIMGIFVLIFVGCKNIKMAGTTISYNGLIEE
jgi:hypothetical protein